MDIHCSWSFYYYSHIPYDWSLECMKSWGVYIYLSSMRNTIVYPCCDHDVTSHAARQRTSYAVSCCSPPVHVYVVLVCIVILILNRDAVMMSLYVVLVCIVILILNRYAVMMSCVCCTCVYCNTHFK